MNGIGFKEVANNLMDPYFQRSEVVEMLESRGDFSANGPHEPGYRMAGARKFQDKYVRRAYESDLKEAMRLTKRALDGDKWAILLFQEAMQGRVREALTISDFPSLFGDIIDRAVLANYKETPYTWDQIAKVDEVADFRLVRRIRVDYGTGLPVIQAANAGVGGTNNPNAGLLTPIEVQSPYPEDKLTDSSYTYNLQKFGKRMPFAWETMINDDLNAIKDTPARFGIAMRRLEEYFVTQLFANNTNFFTAANKNRVKSADLTVAPPVTFSNPPLSIAALQQARLVLSRQKDPTGQPISVESTILVVPPDLEVYGMNIMNATSLLINEQGGTLTAAGSGATASNYNAQRIEAQNWMRGKVRILVNYQLPIIDTTYGGTGWYLFADPNYRPALIAGKLRGHRAPELFMKLPNSVAIGEGTMGPGAGPGGPGMPGTFGGGIMGNPIEGDFETDAIHYKIRNIIGGTQVDPIMAVYSNGSNV